MDHVSGPITTEVYYPNFRMRKLKIRIRKGLSMRSFRLGGKLVTD